MPRRLPAWLAAAAARLARRPNRAARRLGLEALEARDVPAAYTWTPTAPGEYSWSDPNNWGGAGFPNAAADTADLTAALTGNQVIDLSTDVTVGALNLGSSGSGTGAYTIAGNGHTLTLQASSGAATLTQTAASDGDAILAPVTFPAGLTVTNNAAAALAVFGALAGSGTLTVGGTGALALPNGASPGTGVTLTGTGTITSPTVLYAESYSDSALYAFDAASGHTLATIVAPYTTGGPLLGPAGLAVGPDGNLYLSSQSNNTILKYDLGSFTLSTFITSAQLDAARTGTSNSNAVFAPAGLAFGPTDGDLYVILNGGQNSAGGGSVIRFDIAGGTYAGGAGTFHEVVNGLYQPAGLTFGPGVDDTTLYVTSTVPQVVLIGGTPTVVGFDGRITKVTDAGGAAPAQSELIAPGAGGVAYPSGIAFGPDGKLYVADLAALEQYLPPGSETGKVVRFDADGSNPVQFNQGAAGSLSQQFPSGVVFDAAGNLLTANLGPAGPTTGSTAFDGSVYRFNPDGTRNAVVVSSSQFPNTGTTAGGQQESGVMPSQVALVAGSTLDLAGPLTLTGTLTVPDTTLGAGKVFSFQLAAGGNGELASTGTVNLNNAIASAPVAGGFTAPLGSVYTVVSAPGGLTGTFAGLSNGTVVTLTGGQEFRVNYTGTAVTLTRVQSPQITSANAATFYTGKSNTFTVTTTGSPVPALSATGLPTGVTLTDNHDGTATISGTPAAAGSSTVTITASSPGLTTANQMFTLDVQTGVAPSFTSADHVSYVAGTGGQFTPAATGTPAPTIGESGALPTGVTFSGGKLTVAGSTAQGTYTFNFTASNGVGGTVTQPFTLVVGTPPQITSGTGTTFYTGKSNTFTFTATGSPTPAIGFSGALPPGVTFDAATHSISGTPTATGSFPITVTADNGVGTPASQTFTIDVQAGVAPTITSADHALVGVGLPVSVPFDATGNPTPTINVTGPLPGGVTFDSVNDKLVGTPNAGTAGVYTLTVSADNGVGGGPVTQQFTLTVGTVPAFTSADHKTFYTGTFNGFTVAATGSPPPTLSEGEAPPAGLSFDPATGALSGTPTAAPGTYTLHFTADNGVGSPVTQTFTLDLQAGAAPSFTSANTALFKAGTGGTFTVTASGNPAPTLSEIGSPPTGVTFDPATGTLTVDPSAAAGAYSLTFSAANALGTATQGFTLTLGTSPSFTSANNFLLVSGQAGSFAVTASGTPSPTFAVTGGSLPAGVTLDPNGLLHGTSSAPGTYPVTITASNGISPAATQQFTLTVGQAPQVTSAAEAAFTAGTGGTFQVTATGTPTPTLGVTGAPAGVTFDPASGTLTVGTSAAAGTYQLTVTATNSVGFANQSLTLTVALPDYRPARLSVGGQPGGGSALFDPTGGQYSATPTAVVNPFSPATVATRSAVGDVDGDGTPDTILVTGPGVPIRFAVVSGADNRTVLVAPTAPFAGSEDFTGGGFVSAGDLDGDGRADVVVTPDQGGGPRVTVFSLPSGGTLTVRANFLGIDDPNFRGGARTAVGDVNHDHRPDLAVAAGFLGGPRVALYDGATLLTTQGKLVNDFYAFPGTDAVTLRNGAYVAIGDVTGDGFAELIFGGGPGGAPRVFVLDGAKVAAGNVAGAQATPVANFFVNGDSASRGGARVAAVDADGDHRADIAVGSGPGQPARVRVYLATGITPSGEPTAVQDLLPFGGDVLADGVYVG